MIYLDNAATTAPKPAAVQRAVAMALRDLSANPGRAGHGAAMAGAELLYRTREKAARFFGCTQPEQVVFTPGCTASANMVLKGVLFPGDHLVISSLEHNAVSRPAHTLAAQGVAVTAARVVPGDDVVTLNNFRNAMRHNTRLIMVCHASNAFGVVAPVAALGKLCRERGVLLGVDAAQTAGVLPIDVRAMGIDFLCVAAHKGLYAPMGTGLLISSTHKLRPLIEGGTGTQSIEQHQPPELPERLESGTLNLPGIAGLSAGLDFVMSRGTAHIYAHEMSLLHPLYTALQQMGATLYVGPGVEIAPVLSFNLGDQHSFDVAARLDEAGIAVRAGLQCAPMAHQQFGTIKHGTVRISPSAFTTNEDIDRLIVTLRRMGR